MGVLSSTLSILLAVFFFLSPPASACSLTLQDSLIYDADLGIYWMQDGKFNQNTKMTWQEANAWLASLNEKNYGGYSDWRLPTTPPGSEWGYDGSNGKKYNVTVSELGHLFYLGLGLQGKIAPNGTSNQTYGLGEDTTPFTGLQPGYYWFGTTSELSDEEAAWKFDFQHGTQFLDTIDTYAYAIAVRKATPAPEPTSALLFLAGLLGMSRVRRQQNR